MDSKENFGQRLGGQIGGDLGEDVGQVIGDRFGGGAVGTALGDIGEHVGSELGSDVGGYIEGRLDQWSLLISKHLILLFFHKIHLFLYSILLHSCKEQECTFSFIVVKFSS